MPAQNDALAVIVAMVMALAATAVATLAGVMGALPATQQTTPDQACVEWTDGCVVCSRTPEGLACSTPGIACQKGQTRCLRR
jgi:hypothetical protein